MTAFDVLPEVQQLELAELFVKAVAGPDGVRVVHYRDDTWIGGHKRLDCLHSHESAGGGMSYTYVWRHPECYTLMLIHPDGPQAFYEVAECGFCLDFEERMKSPCPYHPERHEHGPSRGERDAKRMVADAVREHDAAAYRVSATDHARRVEANVGRHATVKEAVGVGRGQANGTGEAAQDHPGSSGRWLYVLINRLTMAVRRCGQPRSRATHWKQQPNWLTLARSRHHA